MSENRGATSNNQAYSTSPACRNCHRPRVEPLANRMRWPSSDRRYFSIAYSEGTVCPLRCWLGRGCTRTQTRSPSKRVQYCISEDSTNGNLSGCRCRRVSRTRTSLFFTALLIPVDMANVHGERNVLVVGLAMPVLTMSRPFVVFAVPRRLGALRVPKPRMMPADSVMGSRREEWRSRD